MKVVIGGISKWLLCCLLDENSNIFIWKLFNLLVNFFKIICINGWIIIIWEIEFLFIFFFYLDGVLKIVVVGIEIFLFGIVG